MRYPVRHSSSSTAIALAVLVLVTTACGGGSTGTQIPKGLANCGAAPMLTVSPIEIASIRDLTPLGNLNPPAHTLPTDHLYFYAHYTGTRVQIPVRSPGDVVVSEVGRRTRLTGAPSVTEYSLVFFPCADLNLYFGNVELTTELETLIGPFTQCAQSSSGGNTFESCTKRVNIKLTAGKLIGSMGGDNGNTIDFGGYDRRVPQLAFINPARSYGYGTEFGHNRTICPVDYFVPNVAAALRDKFSGLFGKRTIEPVCGTVMQDLPNTAQGRWFFNESMQDDSHLALAHDNADPRIAVISVGTSIPSLPTRYWGFTPAPSGRVNADFPRVTADGLTYCYQTFVGATSPIRHVLIQLISATRVKIEGFTGAQCGDQSTWAFTTGAREFAR